MKDKNWSVTVNIDGEDILCLSSNGLSGVNNVEEFRGYVLLCAEHLTSFIGQDSRESDICVGGGQHEYSAYYSGVGAYPCVKCGKLFEPF